MDFIGGFFRKRSDGFLSRRLFIVIDNDKVDPAVLRLPCPDYALYAAVQHNGAPAGTDGDLYVGRFLHYTM
jgi:hypothetical protein